MDPALIERIDKLPPKEQEQLNIILQAFLNLAERHSVSDFLQPSESLPSLELLAAYHRA